MYVYYIWYIEKLCKNLPAEEKKALSKTNSVSFNTLK